MRNTFLVTLLMLLAVSCNNNTNNKNTETADSDMKIMIPESGCYGSFSGSDTVLLKIEVFPTVVTGLLKYQLQEKDKNEGTIEGKLYGDTLIADYTFFSEGKSSVREVAFLIQGDQATEGYGNMAETNGKMVFTDKSAIDFSKGIKLNPIDCVTNDSLFRSDSN